MAPHHWCVPPAARDPVVLATSLIAALTSLILLSLGTRVVLTRRLPRPRRRFGRSATTPRPGPIRLGGFAIFLGTGLLLHQAALLLPMARGIRIALTSASWLAILASFGWLVLRRD
jgi:hypothetical protein